MSIPSPLQQYHFHVSLIWWHSPFNILGTDWYFFCICSAICEWNFSLLVHIALMKLSWKWTFFYMKYGGKKYFYLFIFSKMWFGISFFNICKKNFLSKKFTACLIKICMQLLEPRRQFFKRLFLRCFSFLSCLLEGTPRAQNAVPSPYKNWQTAVAWAWPGAVFEPEIAELTVCTCDALPMRSTFSHWTYIS
jgi:hypothetical protein